MKIIISLVVLYTVFSIGVTREEKHFFLDAITVKPAKSCLDFLQNGVVQSGYYQIFDDHNNRYTVFCDFTSEPGSAWTLVMSFTMERRFMSQFRLFLQSNEPVNKKTANWNSYRMTRDMMESVTSQSTHWRYTCSFENYSIDYTDYARAKISALNPLTFDADGRCAVMEYINVRGIACAECKATWWQPKDTKRILHLDSFKNKCDLKSRKGAIKWEDNFGFYDNANPKFRCTANDSATTNLWFGGYL